MYSEREYKSVLNKSLEYKRLVNLWHARSRTALTGLGIVVVLDLLIVSMGGFHTLVSIVAIAATIAWLAVHMWAVSKANGFHQKDIVAERYLADHRYDYNNYNKEKN